MLKPRFTTDVLKGDQFCLIPDSETEPERIPGELNETLRRELDFTVLEPEHG